MDEISRMEMARDVCWEKGGVPSGLATKQKVTQYAGRYASELSRD
jgi:hypothetical protein